MTKQYDFSDFDEAPKDAPVEKSGYDFSDFDEPAAPEAKASDALPELGRAEAAATSFGQGASLGTSPIFSGLVGAAGNAVEQLGDKLGLTTDSELADQGFTQPDKKTGLEGLLQSYYDSRDRAKQHQNAASEQYPVQSIVANIAGSIPTTIASGGATGALSKVLPSASNIAGASRGMKILQGVKEGAKAGALTGFGSGDAHLAEGDIASAARETADSAVGGGIVGGVLPAAAGVVKGAAGLAKNLPIVEDIATAFKGGRAGISLNEESAGNAIKTYSEELLEKIKDQFRQAKMTKANAIDYADEVGVRVNAGEKFQDVMDDIISRGATSTEDAAEKLKLYKSLKNLKDGAPDNLQVKQDVANAKLQQKMEAKGYTPLDSQDSSNIVQDFVPGSDAQKKLALTQQTFQAPIVEGAEEGALPTVTKLIQQVGDELPINIKKYDLNNLSLKDLEDVLGEVNRHTGDLSGPAKTGAEVKARGLAAELRRMSEDAIDGMGNGSSGNKSLSRTFAATKRAGIDDDILTGNQVRQDTMVDKLRNTVTAGNPINRERMFQYLNESDPNAYKGMAEGADFLNKFNDLVKSGGSLNSTNLKGLAGSAKGVVAKTANAAGKMVTGLTDLVDVPVEKLTSIAQKMGMSQNKGSQQFASPLLKAAQTADSRKRSAILYGLYQQPAFRDAYQSMGEAVDDVVLPVGTDREDKN